MRSSWIEMADDVPLVRAHVVAKIEDLVGTSGVMFDGVVLARDSGTDEHSCVTDEQDTHGVVIWVHREFGSSHGFLLGS